ncbi:MAG: GAF domain-containing protein, partial [Proteobacteria bacterium]|nr:GAF domain-containing protein [Pseudomonadota bacterium]
MSINKQYPLEQGSEKLTEALSRCYEEINLLHRIGDLTVNSKNLTEQVNPICKQLREVIECDNVAIIWNDLSEKSIPAKNTKRRPEVFQEGKYLLAANSISAIWQKANRVSINNTFIIENKSDIPGQVLQCEIGNYIIAPIITNHGTVGAISACGKNNSKSFSSLESRLVLSIANKLANCHENQTLYTHQQELLMGTLRALISSIDAKDPYTCGHSERVAKIS